MSIFFDEILLKPHLLILNYTENKPVMSVEISYVIRDFLEDVNWVFYQNHTDCVTYCEPFIPSHSASARKYLKEDGQLPRIWPRKNR